MKQNVKNPHEGHRTRLRQKFKNGKETFKEHELLELLLSFSIPRRDTNELAHELINKFGSLKGVLNTDADLLSTILGVGENSACFLTLIGYICKYVNSQPLQRKEFSNISEAKDNLIELFKNYTHEVFYILYLDKHNKILGTTLLDSNSKNSVLINFEELTKGLLIYKPDSIIVAHNHFAKYPKPSNDDDIATEKIYTLLKLYKVNFFDHLIVSGNEIYSYFYDNRLQKLKETLNSDLL